MAQKNSILSFQLETKAIDEKTGTFTGYGSVFGVEDSYSDIVVPGAFAKSLARWKKKGIKPALLWQHNQHKPCGVITSLSEDKNGLVMEAQLALGTQIGKEAYEFMQMGALTGLSIGYSTVNDRYDREKDVRYLEELELWEVSLVTFPANDAARITQVKNARDAINTERDFEGFLRDVGGFSQSEAKAIVAGGFKALKHRDDDAGLETGDNTELLEALKSLHNSFTTQK